MCSLSLLPRSRADAGWHACSRCFAAPVVKPFDHNVHHILAHISTSFLGHMNHNTEDISITVSLLLPCQQPRNAISQSCSPAIRWSKYHALFVTTCSIQYLATLQNPSLTVSIITMPPFIIITAVCRRACPGCLGDLLCSPLNRYMNRGALYHDCVFPSCT